MTRFHHGPTLDAPPVGPSITMLQRTRRPLLRQAGAAVAAALCVAACLVPATASAGAGLAPDGTPDRAGQPVGRPAGLREAAPGTPRAAGTDTAVPSAPGDYTNTQSSPRHPLPPQAGGNQVHPLRPSAANSFSTDYLIYRGGYTQIEPHLYIVYWGDWSATGDPYNVQNRLYYFLKGVGGSSWNKTATQYGYNCSIGTFSCPSTATHIINAPDQLKGYWKDSSVVPLQPTDAQIRNEVVRAAAYFGDYGRNAQYIIATPRGRSTAGFASGWCAYHNYTTAAGSALSYTNLPYMPDAGTYCGANSVNGSMLDGVTMIEGHEYNESETDPYPSGASFGGWNDSTVGYGESGDKCNWTTYRRNMTFTTGTFPVQPTWSNYDRYFNGSGCMFWS